MALRAKREVESAALLETVDGLEEVQLETWWEKWEVQLAASWEKW